ncbi:hypothetical protein CPC16_006622, partial [Podila verticillata]
MSSPRRGTSTPLQTRPGTAVTPIRTPSLRSLRTRLRETSLSDNAPTTEEEESTDQELSEDEDRTLVNPVPTTAFTFLVHPQVPLPPPATMSKSLRAANQGPSNAPNTKHTKN